MSVVAKWWMDDDATWYGSRPRPRHIALDGDTAPPLNGHSSPPPLFDPCLLWPQLPISATAELLLQMIAPRMCAILSPKVLLKKNVQES